MPYYPKSQIKTNLYTNGNEYILATTGENYKGYYYTISTGKKYVGKIPTYKNSIQIIPVGEKPYINPQQLNTFIYEEENDASNSRNIPLNRMSSDFSQINNETLQNNYIEIDSSKYVPPSQVYVNRQVPTFSSTLPTLQDYDNGYFTRYFCKKTNELKYLEIDQATYTKLSNQDKDIAWDLYSPAQIKWQITGDSSQIYTSNLASAQYIESTENWAGFSQYFKNKFTKYIQ